MNEEFKKEWVEALESDKFTQGRGLLHTPSGLCCLGVACYLLEKKGVLTKTILKEDNVVRYGIEENPALLPKEAIEYMGVESSSPQVLTMDLCHVSLSSLNDNGMTFKEIAQIIREQL